jgi:hypothetical protein
LQAVMHPVASKIAARTASLVLITDQPDGESETF